MCRETILVYSTIFLVRLFDGNYRSALEPLFFSARTHSTAIVSPSTLVIIYVVLIIYYIANLPVTRVRLLTNKSDNLAARSFAALIHRLVRFQLTSPLILLLSSIELRLFDSLLRSSWDARITSRILDIQSYTHKNSLLF